MLRVQVRIVARGLKPLIEPLGLRQARRRRVRLERQAQGNDGLSVKAAARQL
jgi:hypothetical protein